MAVKKPVVIDAGQIEQLQAGDSIDAASSELITSPTPPVTNHSIARFDGTDGHALEECPATMQDTGQFTINTDPGLQQAGAVQEIVKILDSFGGLQFSIQASVRSQGNMAIGDGAGTNIDGGIDNLLFGHSAGAAVVTASNIVAIGLQAGESVTSGDSSIYIGVEAGGDVTTGTNNIMIGPFAGQTAGTTITNCTGIGVQTLLATTGNSNTGIGPNAGRSITSGINNTFIGPSAGFNSGGNITGNSNTGIGPQSMNAATSATNNTFIGNNSGTGVTTANNNVGIGVLVISSGNASNCVAIGIQSLSEATGGFNTAAGGQSGRGITSGVRNTFVGYEAGRTTIGQPATASDTIAVGRRAVASKSNQAVFGSSDITETVLRGDVEVRNGTTAQELHVYETYTSDSNFERFRVSFSGGVCTLETDDDGTTGTASALALGTNGVKRTEIGADGVVASGSVFQPGHFIAGYSSGTAYTLTGSYAEVTGGTSNSAIVLDQPGTYKITCHMITRYVGTNFGSGETIDIKLRRTNNTAADLANSEVFMNTYEDASVTAGFEAQPKTVFYTTANSDDRIALFARLSALPGAGSVEIHSDHIIAERVA